MIEDSEGNKCTPKEKAKEVIAASIRPSVEKWIESNMDAIEKMTDRELDLLNDQLEKQLRRVYKLLGIEEMVNHAGEVEEL